MSTKLRDRIVEAAKARLEQYPWYAGVCLDMLPRTDEAILEKGFDAVVDDLVYDTVYWDSPTEIPNDKSGDTNTKKEKQNDGN